MPIGCRRIVIGRENIHTVKQAVRDPVFLLKSKQSTSFVRVYKYKDVKKIVFLGILGFKVIHVLVLVCGELSVLTDRYYGILSGIDGYIFDKFKIPFVVLF